MLRHNLVKINLASKQKNSHRWEGTWTGESATESCANHWYKSISRSVGMGCGINLWAERAIRDESEWESMIHRCWMCFGIRMWLISDSSTWSWLLKFTIMNWSSTGILSCKLERDFIKLVIGIPIAQLIALFITVFITVLITVLLRVKCFSSKLSALQSSRSNGVPVNPPLSQWQIWAIKR